VDVLNSLWGERDNALAEARKINETAARFKRDLSSGEQARWDQLMGHIDELDKRINEVHDLEERNAKADEVRAQLRGHAPAPQHRGNDGSSVAVEAFRSAVLERNPAPIEVRDDSPKFVRHLGAERRDLLTSAPANFRPVSFHDKILVHMIETSSVLRAGATLLTTTTGEDLRVPKATADSTAAIVAEAATIGESDPTLSVVTLGAYKYAVRFEVSSEMVQDTTVDLESYLAQQAGRAIGTALGAHLITGSGTGQPRGAHTAASVGVTGPTGTATSFGTQATAGQGTDLLNSLYGSLAEPYVTDPSASTAFLLRNATLTAIRNLKTSAGDPVGTTYVANAPAPFYVDPNVQAMGANNESVICGDWSRYFVRYVNGIRFDRSDHAAWDRDMVSFRAILRADGNLIDENALKMFSHSAT
jgi:HK97 family phage major capsid protein